MSRSTLDYLRHIQDEAAYLLAARQELKQETFLQDGTLKRAFVRSLEVIGEATKQLPSEFRSKYAHVEWRALAGMRDKLIHHYFGVDYELVWDIATTKIPELAHDVELIIEQEKE